MEIGNSMKELSRVFFEETKTRFLLHDFENAYHSFNTFNNLFRAKQHNKEEIEFYRGELEEMLVVSLSFIDTILELGKYELCEKLSSITKNIIKLLEREL